MEAKDGVVERLNKVLTAELTAVHQYLLHAALCKHWGYERLHDHFTHLAQEEVAHSAGLMDRILYLNGAPEVQKLDAVATGNSVADLFSSDLAFEVEDRTMLQECVAHCAAAGDFTTRHLLEHMLIDTDEHIDWFETQLRTIKQVGLDRYLAEQMKK